MQPARLLTPIPPAPASPSTSARRRFWEIDVLRGGAVIMMSFFHLSFDLAVYMGFGISLFSGPVYWVGRLSAIFFMVISGLTSTLGGRQWRRGLTVLAAALVVTLASIPLTGANYVRFGILHFFAAAMLGKAVLDSFIKNYTPRLMLAAAGVPLSFYLGGVVQRFTVNTPLLLPLGVMYPGFSSFDYYPLFPWLGWFCLGATLGLVLYRDKIPFYTRLAARFGGPGNTAAPLSQKPPFVLRPFAFLGRHSLAVYLIHQPLFLAVLWLLAAAGILPPMVL